MGLSRYLPSFILVAVLLPAHSSSQNTEQDPQDPQDPRFRIEIDVAGKVQKKNKDEWIELRSRNFLVVGDADEKDLRMAASELELFRSAFAQMFARAKEVSSVRTTVVVFRDSRLLNNFRPIDDGESGQSGRGYITPGSDINYIALKAGEKMPPDVIREYVRLLSRDSIPPIPLWFQEGLAEYFSTYKLERLGEDRLIKLGLDEYKEKLNEKKLIPLTTLFSMSQESLASTDEDTRKLFRSQSVVLFAYLLQARRLSATLRFFNAMAEGQPMAKGFRDTFKLSLPTFEENFSRSIKASKLSGWTVTFVGFTLDPKKRAIRIIYGMGFVTLPVSFDSVRADVDRLPVRLLPESQAQFYRGDLLLHNQRVQEAVPLLENAIELDPKQAAAHASLALAQARRNRHGEAQESIDRAIELDPDNYLARYYSALFIRESNGLEDEMKAELMKSVALAPEFVEAAELLAEVHLLQRGDLAAAARLLLDGLKRSPGRESLLLALARVVAEAGDKSSAGWMLQRVISSGSSDTRTKRDARGLLAQLDLTLEQRTAFGTFAIDESAEGKDQGIQISSTKANGKDQPRSADQEKVVRGLLTKVDCSKGLTLYISIGIAEIDQRTENLHTDTPANIDWVTDNGEEITAVACGVTLRRVAITYRPQRKGLMMGVPLVVQFLSLPD